MTLIQGLENYILDLLLFKKKDIIMTERFNSYHTINLVFCDKTISYLLYHSKNIVEIRNKDFSDYLKLCQQLQKEKNNYKLIKTLEHLENINIPIIYKFFFNKIIIYLKLHEFYKYPFIDNMIDDFPNRIIINNQFDLEEDIVIITQFLKKMCFNNMEFILENINNKACDYLYFFKILKYEIYILPETKIIFNNLVENIIIIEAFFKK